MPVTRSHKGGHQEETGSGASTSTTTTSTTTTESTATASTEATQTTETSESSAATTAASQPGQAMTLVPAGSTRRAATIARSRASTTRRRLEAREELARLELEEAQARARLARLRLQLADEADEDSTAEEDDVIEAREDHLRKWIQSSADEPSKCVHPLSDEEPPPKKKTEAQVEVQTLATALKEALSQSAATAPQPKYMQELPTFEGDSAEWTAFRVFYEDTAPSFSAVQNMARLRRAIKGAARETIKSLLYSEAKPAEILDALRRRFGRPDALVLAELDKIKALPRTSENPRDICIFASQVNNSVAAIKGLNRPQYLHSPEIVKHIIEKLPTILKFRWYDFSKASNEESFANIELVSAFLNNEADMCGAFAAIEAHRPQRQGAIIRRPIRHTTYNMADEQRSIQCPSCEGAHRLPECQQFVKAAVADRWDTVKKLNICFKCLTGKHRKETCRRPPCKVCKRWHHNLLHDHSKESQRAAPSATPASAAPPAASVNTIGTTKAFLKMIPVEVYGPSGSKKILALLDEGSTVTLLDEEVATSIGARGPRTCLSIETIGGRLMETQKSMTLDLELRGNRQSKKEVIKQVRTVNNLKLTPQLVDKQRLRQCKHLRNIVRDIYHEGEAPKLLIGQDNWEYIVTRRVRRGKPGQPVASQTKLGWVLHGADSNNLTPINYVNICAHINAEEDEVARLVKEHFAIESLGVQPKRPSTDAEGQALKILEATSNRLQDGRFEVGLLWKNKEVTLPNNYLSALNRYKGIEKKLQKDALLRQQYGEQINNLLNNEYAESAPADSTSTRKWYLPHFPVVHPVKKKLRIVFDAAAKTSGVSLNDTLLPGPDLLQSLFGVLLRFRQGPIAVAADIKEMFLQVRIINSDRDSLRFLWRDAPDAPVKEYRMTSVIFGAASSPCTAIYIKNRNAQEFKEQFPEAARAVEKNHYMDDYLQSFHSIEECKTIIKQVDTIHQKARFELRGWASNNKEVIATEGAEEVNLGDSTEEKTLGLRWLTRSDKLGFRSQCRKVPSEVAQGMKTPTKREVTAAVMSTFDPLGLVSPIVIQGKKLIQSIWRSGVGWDDEITEEDTKHWLLYLEDMKRIQDIQLARCISPTSTEGELHIFTDASETAYAATVYWRTKTGGKFEVSLIAAKTRVTPLKPVSVPRLELQAALLGSRLADSVEKELDLKIVSKTYWTDSSVVLSWIKTDPRTFKTFVAHRLAEIEDLTKPHEWRWVPTAENPADDATRDLPRDFNATHRWFTGPAFLKKNEDCWPAPRTFRKQPTDEEKPQVESTYFMSSEEQVTPAPEKFSSWKKLWRTTARVLQFISLCSKKNADEKTRVRTKKTARFFIPIDEEQLQRAEELLVQRSQKDSFGKEIASLQAAKSLESSSKLKKLDVMMKDGLLRLRGRANAIKGVQSDYLAPIILEARSQVGKLLISDYHKRFNHGNQATVMNEIRQRYWMIGLRSVLRSVQQKCQHCKATRGKPAVPPMGDLPRERLQHGAHPFTCTGVDYFGPLTVTVGRRREKRWGALFTCLTTRAVHMELVPSLTTDSTIMALRRFAARRGTPKTIYSDNGTNFVRANKELQAALRTLEEDELATEAEKIGVRWKFIPPGAPNMGGAWERMVGSIKTALSATLKDRHPREEVLSTLLLEAEHMVNSRPLTNIADNAEEEALTPNHFLIGRSCGAARIGNFPDTRPVGREDWKAVQQLADHLWRRWLREYLPTLLPRKIDGRTGADLEPGDVVLIVDRTLPRCTWPRGRIQKTYPGPDGRTRIVDVATRGGVLRRPASKIVLLVPATESPRQEESAAQKGRMSAT